MLAIAGGALWFGRGGQTVAPPPIARPGNPPLPVPTPPATEAAPASAASEPTAPGRRKEPESHTAQRQDEVRLVSRAQRALGNNPALAFSLAERHRALFPGGALAQEREVIAVEALRALRRPAEAEARARRFRARYPDSAHLPRVEGQRL
jgi:hypothetical protein